MNPHDPSRPVGPGHTNWYKDARGDLMVSRHNDAGWCTVFQRHHSQDTMAFDLRRAYEMGFEDAKLEIRRTLGIKG